MIFTAVRPADHNGHTLADRSMESLRADLAAGWLFVGFISIDAELTWREARNAFVFSLENQADREKSAADDAVYFGGNVPATRRAWERACGQLMAEIDKLTPTEGAEFGTYRLSA
jgi:hypothetical protein